MRLSITSNIPLQPNASGPLTHGLPPLIRRGKAVTFVLIQK
jgi:hypothetical protein